MSHPRPLPVMDGDPGWRQPDSPAPDRDEDLVQVQGVRPSEPLLVRRGWLRDHLTNNHGQRRRGTQRPAPSFVPCDPLTGARLDPGDHLSTDTYRPGPQLAALVRARDGRCRFPGCSVAARFCDLDHVRPWPTGPTTATNLLTVCRRHHRIKQRPGWRVHLAGDGTTTWADPTGRERTTAPLDALKTLVLTADAAPTGRRRRAPPTPSQTGRHPHPTPMSPPPRRGAPSRPTSSSPSNTTPTPTATSTRGHRRPTAAAPRAADLRAGLARRRAKAATPDAPPF